MAFADFAKIAKASDASGLPGQKKSADLSQNQLIGLGMIVAGIIFIVIAILVW